MGGVAAGPTVGNGPHVRACGMVFEGGEAIARPTICDQMTGLFIFETTSHCRARGAGALSMATMRSAFAHDLALGLGGILAAGRPLGTRSILRTGRFSHHMG